MHAYVHTYKYTSHVPTTWQAAIYCLLHSLSHWSFFNLRATQALISCIGMLPFHCAKMNYTRPTEPTDQGQHVANDTVLCCSWASAYTSQRTQCPNYKNCFFGLSMYLAQNTVSLNPYHNHGNVCVWCHY